jgi:hypothetical protein
MCARVHRTPRVRDGFSVGRLPGYISPCWVLLPAGMGGLDPLPCRYGKIARLHETNVGCVFITCSLVADGFGLMHRCTGYFCPAGSATPQSCPADFMCPSGAASPVPCPPGQKSRATAATCSTDVSNGNGAWCVSGGVVLSYITTQPGCMLMCH